ncbi:hypothetical protein P154DRAFT_337406 [Amniculicola lignicola CBS 123094]|uniref:Uncharacterized protein n=1 Tax=Amniculicola lignicola CBS 123094 TaxID=1392246 RepID=A0A6A5X2F8_9PLEO|nr:hypothetical protein P154DRAFT_337406 [Amniculicola lignicola CBS 123094]
MSTGKESQPSMRFIKRNRHLTDESLPWAGIAFDPPVGSDELFHQLKSAYPSCDNLRQRKHLATIQFLIVELDAMRKKDSEQSKISKSAEDQETRYSNNPANGAADDLDYGCNPQHMPSSESPSGSSSVHSPELVDRSRTLVEDASGPAASSTLSREGEQIIVFDAKDGRSVQPRTKRRMTYEEKIAYKRKRRIGACDQCRRSKGRVMTTPFM